MLPTLRHNDTDAAVAAAKLLTGFLRVSAKIADPDAFLRQHSAFDAEFVAHICTWQRNHGLTPDGVIGPATWRKITAAAPTCSTSKNRISAAAAAVQLLLGSANLTADGVYGSRTKNAVAAFQSARGLTADGFCGPKTW